MEQKKEEPSLFGSGMRIYLGRFVMGGSDGVVGFAHCGSVGSVSWLIERIKARCVCVVDICDSGHNGAATIGRARTLLCV